MHDLAQNKVRYGIPLTSSYTMLFQASVLKQLHGFSVRFFLYSEDYDSIFRTHNHCQFAYASDARNAPIGGDDAKESLQHSLPFILSAITLFNLHGWKLW